MTQMFNKNHQQLLQIQLFLRKVFHFAEVQPISHQEMTLVTVLGKQINTFTIQYPTMHTSTLAYRQIWVTRKNKSLICFKFSKKEEAPKLRTVNTSETKPQSHTWVTGPRGTFKR